MYNDYQTRLQDFEKKLGVVNPEWFKQFFMMLEKSILSPPNYLNIITLVITFVKR